MKNKIHYNNNNNAYVFMDLRQIVSDVLSQL